MNRRMMIRAQRIIEVLLIEKDLLVNLAVFLMTDGLENEGSHEIAERVCEAAFGERIECPRCGSFVLPGFTCLDCGDEGEDTSEKEMEALRLRDAADRVGE